MYHGEKINKKKVCGNCEYFKLNMEVWKNHGGDGYHAEDINLSYGQCDLADIIPEAGCGPIYHRYNSCHKWKKATKPKVVFEFDKEFFRKSLDLDGNYFVQIIGDGFPDEKKEEKKKWRLF